MNKLVSDRKRENKLKTIKQGKTKNGKGDRRIMKTIKPIKNNNKAIQLHQQEK